MRERVLVAVVGKTDPIRGYHDGPILHIVRHYRPRKAVLLLSEELAETENKYHHNETAIRLLAPDCEIEIIHTGIRDVHSYDGFSVAFLEICSRIRQENEGKEILLNITSGTPQMETALCMIAMSDPAVFTPIQVFTPERSANKATFFDPGGEETIEEWYEADLDNEDGAECRCHEPQLLNFKRPMLKFQIGSLIHNYDYAGAYQLYQDNRGIIPEKAGMLIDHARKRLNLEHDQASRLAKRLKLEKELYPIERSDIAQLVEFFNSIRIKQMRGELNDFSMRLEILTLYLAKYILEKGMNIPLIKITESRKTKNTVIMYLSREKSEQRIPGIGKYLDEQFSDRKEGAFTWNRPVNALSLVYILAFLVQRKEYKKYGNAVDELIKWSVLSGQVRNPAAHTIIAITDQTIRDSYDNKDSGKLCKAIYTVLKQVFSSEASDAGYDIYHWINRSIMESL